MLRKGDVFGLIQELCRSARPSPGELKDGDRKQAAGRAGSSQSSESLGVPQLSSVGEVVFLFM